MTFDFISGQDFRLSLEADYHELNLAIQAKAWKAAHVLAGSIIEAILIDYLIAMGYKKLTQTDILKLELGDAIKICRNENILSEKTEHLSHVIRSFRNLIHPGRLVRLGETADENGAKIAQALVEIIAEEIASRKKEHYGHTAEQIISKLEKDSSSLSILEHLLKDTNEYEKERLLIDVIQARYFDLQSLENKPHITLYALEACYRYCFENATDQVKQKAVKNFVKSIKEENANVIWRYAFFRGADLAYASSLDTELITQHFIYLMTPINVVNMMPKMYGIGKYIQTKNLERFLNAFIETIIFHKSFNRVIPPVNSDYSEEAIGTLFFQETLLMDDLTLKHLDDLSKKFMDIYKDSPNKLKALMLLSSWTYREDEKI